ncbi:Gustatory receptor for sugar taste 64f [Frankliniella fusca]|uniref:Gustatory receptor for sugar taste 64f n=1 Tax=Frankliniella fusca TaxID=407009 RepID=A0AAE1H6X8_9NEOP|nr:Gustatory receptor for sugar taste 64f [Frankliniella fusca]
MRLIPVYNIAIVFGVTWSKAQAKFAITYTDLFLWAVGTAVAAHFKSINKKIRKLHYEAMSELDWRRIRGCYNDVVRLISDLDRILGPQLLLSYGMGLWFICGGILLLLDSEIGTLKRVYIFLSTGFWVLRIIFSTLSLASVHEANISIRNSLHLVPTAAYGDEVHRFAIQACHDDLGFTGMRFFTVTRSILLTVTRLPPKRCTLPACDSTTTSYTDPCYCLQLAGTIASYEIVLMEFNR